MRGGPQQQTGRFEPAVGAGPDDGLHERGGPQQDGLRHGHGRQDAQQRGEQDEEGTVDDAVPATR